MKYDELIKELKECDACLRFCVEYCPKTSKLIKDGKCPTTLTKKAADAIEELLGVIQRQKEMINATAYLPLYQKPMKWISVAERLPEKTGEYLVCGQWIGKPVETWVCELIAFGNIKGWANEARNPVVTHWMPLPEPPKDGE